MTCALCAAPPNPDTGPWSIQCFRCRVGCSALSHLHAQLPRAVDRISGQHDAHLIEPGLPGAGNLIVFDNQGEGGYPAVPLGANSGSRVLEIDPVKKQIVWQYTGDNSGKAGWSPAPGAFPMETP